MLLVLGNVVFAAVPPINNYKIEKRPIAVEPQPQDYSISENDQTVVIKPPFSFYTQLNPAAPNELFSIPPYKDAGQLPKIGKWMVAIETGVKNITYVPSHWLDDQSAKGQYIIEPINYIFVVFNKDENAAIKFLTKALINAGFTTKWSGPEYHTDNYHAYIGGKRVSQLKRNDGVFITFSDNHWLKQNDHFRVMGPYKTVINGKQAFLFVSSVSEETAWDQELNAGHFYVSFVHSRDNLAQALIKKGFPTFYVVSDNVLNTPKESTEDHDGKIFVSLF
jgi:hypothetical protein